MRALALFADVRQLGLFGAADARDEVTERAPRRLTLRRVSMLLLAASIARHDAERLRAFRKERRAEGRARECPRCGCRPEGPKCTIEILSDDGDVLASGTCVPRGTFDLKRCTACINAPPGVKRRILR